MFGIRREWPSVEQHGLSTHAMAAFHKDGDEHTPSVEKATCISFCAAEKTTLIKQQLEGSTGMDLLPVLLLSGLIVCLIDQDQGSQQRPHLRPTWPEPPISLRFSRLTI